MASAEQTVRTYSELAQWHDGRGEAPLRDRFLVLAADAALAAGRKDEAEQLRARLLQGNPHHLLRPYPSLADALRTTDVQNYIAGLRRNYPPDKAVQMLEAARSGAERRPSPTAAAVPAAPAPVPTHGIYEFQDDARPAAGGERPRRTGTGGWQPLPDQAAAYRRGNASAAAAAARTARRPASPAAAWRPAPDPDEGREAPAGAWLASLLFWLFLLASLGVAAYALGRPFLPL